MSDAAEPVLRIDRLTVPFGGGPGLDEISLSVATRECVAVVGASGAGKTSLLRAVAGLAPIHGGRIEVGGTDVTATAPERRGIIYLHQTPLLFPHLSVLENVAFPLRVRRIASAEIETRARAALAAVRLEGFDLRRPRTLSGGQRQRVALARAVVARPPVLLLDEPLAALDPALRGEVRDAIEAVRGAYGPAIVLVTHDLDEAGLMADRIGVLVDQRLAQLDRPERLFARPTSLAVARFLGLPNEVAGVVYAGGVFESVLGTLPLGRAAPPGPAVACFRAEAIRLDATGPLRGEVIAVRHRLRQTTAVVRVESMELEVPVSALEPPADGAAVGLAIDPAHLVIFPASECGAATAFQR
jgi:putative spermidine/putrescine transport system ATP-binding protein